MADVIGNLWLILVTGEESKGWKKADVTLTCKRQRGPRELWAHWPHLDSWEGGGAANLGEHSQAR